MFYLEKRLNVINDNRLLKLKSLGYTLMHSSRPLSDGSITSLINGQLFRVSESSKNIHFHVLTSGDELLDAILNHLDVKSYDEPFKSAEKRVYRDSIINVIDYGLKKIERNGSSSAVNQSVENIRERIRDLEDNIGELRKEIVNLTAPKNVEINYDRMFSMNNLKFEPLEGNKLIVHVTTPLTIYNREEARVLFGNSPNKLLKEIFIDRSKVVYFKNSFRINIQESRIEKLSDASNKGNPHISRYNCWGSYKNSAEASIYAGDFMRALMYINSAVSTLTLSDGTVLETFKHCLAEGDYEIREVK